MIFYSHSFKVQTLNLALNLLKYMFSSKPPSLPMHYIWKYGPILLFDHYSQHDIPASVPATQPLPVFFHLIKLKKIIISSGWLKFFI